MKINSLEPTGRQQDYSDGRVPGLKLRVSQSGTRTFALWYRFRGKQRRIRVGRYPEVGLAAARARAQDILRDIENGIDPQAKRREEALTLKSIESEAHRFIRMHVRLNLKSAKDAERILNRDIVGTWRSRDVRDISHEDVLELIDGLQDEHARARASPFDTVESSSIGWLTDG